MATRVTMRIFSCRPNPVRVFTDAAESLLLRTLNALPAAKIDTNDSRLQRTGGLGFRGFLIEAVPSAARPSVRPLASWVSLYGGAADYDLAPARLDANRGAEYSLLDLFFRDLEPDIAALAKKEARDLYADPNCRKGNLGASLSLPDRPKYLPASWNASGVRSRNNCYNWANNRRFTTGDCAIPGAGGNQPAAFGSCGTVSTAVRADGLVNLGAVPSGRLPGHGWPVALFIKPGGDDVHFYRQDKSGRWSHKPGGWPVRACDESGAPILNIQTADTLDYVFCRLFESDDDAVIAPL